MKTLLLIFAIALSSFSINKIVIPQRATPGSTITASKTNENLDTIASKFNKAVDSNDIVFIRYTDLSSGDSTLTSKKADIDTMTIDTAKITAENVTRETVDSSYNRTLQAVTAGITRINADTSHARHPTADSQTVPIELGNKTFRGNITGQDATFDSTDHRIITADSATIPIFKGNETHRDSSYFASGVRGLRLYSPQADIDSFVGDVKFGGNLFNFYSGNLTLGSNYKGIRLGRRAVLMAYQNISTAGLYMSANSYLSNDGWKAIDTGYSCVTEVTPTNFKIDFPNAPSNAGSAVTYSTKFSVDSAGNCTTSTLNTGHGDNELYPMNQDVRTTASPTFVNVTSNLTGNVTGNVSGNSGTVTNGVYTTGSYNDPSWITGLNANKLSGTFTGSVVGNVTGNVSGSSGSCTGNSATATLSDTARAAFIADTSVKAGTAYSLNGGDLLTVYDTGSFACTLKTSWVTVQQVGTGYYTRIGNVVTLSFPRLTGTSNSNQLRINFNLPYNPKISGGAISSWSDVIVYDNGIELVARMGYYEGVSEKAILLDGANFTTSGTKGIARCNFTYICAD